ncbi:MAG: DNA polymerase III subunit beta [Candidatus Ancillula sp.]|jgi:DNA polymerase-3 subunit beta|nr:DNA polymerase III subunit beta [Candidatus Ancillula sp.]
MEFEINKAVVDDALIWVNRFLATRNVTPSLTCIRIIAQSGKVSISAANIETYTTAEVEAHITKEGEAIVVGKTLLDIVRQLPDGAVSFKVANNKLEVEAGKFFGKYPLVATEIIKQELGDDMTEFEVSTPEFAKLISKVGIAVAKDDSTPILTTIKFDISGHVLTATAIDRYRVAKMLIDVKNPTSKEFSVNVKFKNISTIVNGLDKSSTLKLQYDANSQKFGVDAVTKQTISTLIAGEFPNTDGLFKEEYKTTAVVPTKALLDAINRASVLSDVSHPITFSLTPNLLTIENQENDASAKEDVQVEYSGDEMEIKFNSSYIKDGMTQFECEKVKFKIDEPSKPVEVVGIDKDGNELKEYRYVIVPIRTV